MTFKLRHMIAAHITWVLLVVGILAYGAGPAGSQAATPIDDPLLAACAYAAGAAGDLRVTNCRLAGLQLDGNRATVEIRVKLEQLGWFKVRVRMLQTTWAQSGFDAEPE
jgi:hypothetical protein